jgi:Ca2+-binding EF-hand superfamily protein
MPLSDMQRSERIKAVVSGADSDSDGYVTYVDFLRMCGGRVDAPSTPEMVVQEVAEVLSPATRKMIPGPPQF